MINGDLNYFMQKLHWGEELEVRFRGKDYMIQGYWQESADGPGCSHLEMFEITAGSAFLGYEFEHDAADTEECVRAFLAAPLWDGKTFDEAEHEIEWIY